MQEVLQKQEHVRKFSERYSSESVFGLRERGKRGREKHSRNSGQERLRTVDISDHPTQDNINSVGSDRKSTGLYQQ